MRAIVLAFSFLALGLAPAEAATKIRVMYTAVSGYSSVYIAKDQGFFDKRIALGRFAGKYSAGWSATFTLPISNPAP